MLEDKWLHFLTFVKRKKRWVKYCSVSLFRSVNSVLNNNFTCIWKMAAGKASRKMNVHGGKNCLFVCGCRDNAIHPLLHTHFHAFPYLTRAKIFHLPARSDCCVSFLRSFTLSELCLRHVAVNSALAVYCKKKTSQPSEERISDKG